tara:strand:- start:1016 stop:1288 length:273 start_codon:yes stop_codon:yes gene_type:complete
LPIAKKDIAYNISTKLGVTQSISSNVVNSFFEFLKLNRKQKINIHNFGTFSYKRTPERVGRNPKTLQEFKIKARDKLIFSPSDKLKKNIN